MNVELVNYQRNGELDLEELNVQLVKVPVKLENQMVMIKYYLKMFLSFGLTRLVNMSQQHIIMLKMKNQSTRIKKLYDNTGVILVIF